MLLHVLAARLLFAPPPPLEERVKQLEDELQKMRLQSEEEPETAVAAPAAPTSPNLFNPTVTVVGNGLVRFDDRAVYIDPDTRVDDTFNLREIELDFRAAIDPFADGVAIISFPSEAPGEIAAEIEEAYVTIKRLPLPIFDNPPLGLKLKLGRFRPDVGHINRLHLHDLPQSSRPLATDELFGEDGYIANGLSAQVFLPFFDEESALELTAQALAGGGPPVADGPARTPAVVANLRWFRTFAAAHNFDLSLIFHWGRTDPGGDLDAFTYSADFLYKWKPLRRGEYRSFVLGAQVLYTRRDFLDENGVQRSAAPLGWFGFAQLQAAQALYLGARWDDTATLTDDTLRRRAVTAYLTWYTSEFMRFRFSYEHRFSDLAAEDGQDSAFAELTFVFGAHPPEPFWVNR